MTPIIRRLMSCAVVAAALASATISAQSQGNSVKVVGCLNRAEHNGSIAGGPGVPPVSPAASPVFANTNEPTGVFLLNGVAPEAREERGTAGRDNAKKEPAAPPISYVLDGNASDFEDHLGQQVEVTGVVHTANEGVEGAKSEVRHLRADSIKMVAAECPKSAGR